MTHSDIPQVVHLGHTYLSGFLSSLGEEFLHEYYKAVYSLSDTIVFTAKDEKKLIGFVSVTLETKGMFSRVVQANPKGLLTTILKKTFQKPAILKEIISTLTYTGFSKGGAELLTIVIADDYQRMGWGKKLFAQAVKEFETKGIKKFRVSTYDKDEGANRFYKKMGHKRVETFNFRGVKMNYFEYHLS